MQLKMTTKDELQKIVTEQEERLSIYERKLRGT